LGYIGRINQTEKTAMEDWDDEAQANYRGTEYIGKLGLEQSYESELHGVTGFEQIETSAGGRAVRQLASKPATPGNTLQLSIDIRLQALVEELYGNRRGALVAIVWRAIGLKVNRIQAGADRCRPIGGRIERSRNKSMGLVRTQSIPASSACSMAEKLSIPVKATSTSSVPCCARRCRASSAPAISGMIKSSSTQSGCSRSTRANASAPPEAVQTE
jgi:hypothetical protein